MPNTAPENFRIDPDIHDLVPVFLAAREKDADAIERCLRLDAFELIAALAHKIKGSGSSYGFPFISSIGEDLERGTSMHDHDAIAGSVRRLRSYLACVQREVRLRGFTSKHSVSP
jgi:HPt (histidine-containing phosphotransfer) domain-containing protein